MTKDIALPQELCPCNSGRSYETCCLSADKRTKQADHFNRIGVIVGGKDLYGCERSTSNALALIKEIPLWWILQELTSLQILLSNERQSNGDPRRLETVVRQRYFDKSQIAKIERFEKNGTECTILCWQQLLLAIEICCTVCKNNDDSIRSWHECAGKLGKFILWVNDFFAKFDTHTAPAGADRETVLRTMTPMLIKKLIAGHQDEFRYMIPRSWIIFSSLLKQEGLEDFDTDKFIRQELGIGFREFIELIFTLYAYWGSLRIEKWNDKFVKINPNNVFSNLKKSDQILFGKILDIFVRKSVSIMLPDLDYGDWSKHIYSFFDGKRRPLLEHDGVYYCATPDFIRDSAWLWPYYFVIDRMKAGKRDPELFFQHIGRVFEEYIKSLLKFGFGSPEFGTMTTGTENNPLCDGCVFINENTLLVFEIKKYRPTRNIAVDGIPLTDTTDFQQHIRDGFEQMSDRIREYIENNHYTGKVIPILVTMGYLPTTPEIWEFINPGLNDLYLYKNEQIDFPIVSDPLGIEILAALLHSGRSILEILDKLKDNSMWRQGSFKDFLLEGVCADNHEPVLEPLIGLFESILSVTSARFGPKSFPRKFDDSVWREVFPFARDPLA